MSTLISSPGIFPNVSALEYHADCCETPSLSSTIAKELLNASPKHAWCRHPKLGGSGEDGEEIDEKTTKEKECGTLTHRLMLGKGGDIVVCPFDNWRKDVAKAMRDVAKAKGQIPTLPHLKEEADAAAKEARQQLDDMGYSRVFRAGINEVVIVWIDNGVLCRAMVDNLIIDEDSKTAELWDLKTTGRSSHPKACEAQIGNLSYDLSLTFHERGLIALRPDLAGRVKKNWVFTETKRPYAATPVFISAEWEMAAQHKTERAIAKWAECMASNKWPYYVSTLTRLEAKPWLIADEFLNDE